MPRIAILIHERDPIDANYVLYELAKIWRQQAIDVLILPALAAPQQVDLAFLHVDLTFVPPEYQNLTARYPKLLNAQVTDISKRFISRQLVHKTDAWDGPVIIKTNRNYGGIPELIRFGRIEDRKYIPKLIDYPILNSARDVPDNVWNMPDWVVEQFLPERSGEDYCLRTWLFLGDCHIHSLSYSRDPLVKSGTVYKREPLGEVPAELLAVKQQLNMAYGKFDYACVDGRVVLYDVNKTPALGNLNPEKFLQRLPALAKGIDHYLLR
jgi:hypothetical protein